MKMYGLFLLSLLWSSALIAQELPGSPDAKPLSFGVIETIASEALSETRTLNIWLPVGYSPDSAYPVIYVLDGSANEDFPHIAGLAQFLNMYQLLEPSIVVGIANVDRYRDFTYPSQDTADQNSLPTSGGSPAFLRFMETELQPFIEQHYPVLPDRTLIGQSLGGLVATEILMKKPDLFDTYVIVSPSLWWDQQSLLQGAEAYFKQHQELEKQIFVSRGAEHPVMNEVADKLVAVLRNCGNEKLRVAYQPFLTEDHATILHKAVYWALEVKSEK